MGQTYYELLGVSREATDEEIETAYRERLKETHPDVSDESDAQERTKRLIQAKETLTDEKERERYDRLGHQKYVSLEQKAEKSGEPGSESNVDRATASASAGSTGTGATNRGRTAGSTETAGATSTAGTSTNFSGHEAGSTSWYDSDHRSRRERRRQASETSESDDSWHAWDTEGSYAVSTDDKSSLTGDLFSSERAFVMLAVTFMVYPVLLFGSLFPGFPMVFRLIIGVCTLMLIAFLQSVPEVGIAVFATWSVLLPLVLFSAGTSLFTLESLLALTAVVVPLALSVMTRMTLQTSI